MDVTYVTYKMAFQIRKSYGKAIEIPFNKKKGTRAKKAHDIPILTTLHNMFKWFGKWQQYFHYITSKYQK